MTLALRNSVLVLVVILAVHAWLNDMHLAGPATTVSEGMAPYVAAHDPIIPRADTMPLDGLKDMFEFATSSEKSWGDRERQQSSHVHANGERGVETALPAELGVSPFEGWDSFGTAL
jgi:hypothetical protein